MPVISIVFSSTGTTARAAELADFVQKFAARLAAGEAWIPEMPGKRPFKEFKGTPAKPVANDSCGLCGLCAARCPAGAIRQRIPG